MNQTVVSYLLQFEVFKSMVDSLTKLLGFDASTLFAFVIFYKISCSAY